MPTHVPLMCRMRYRRATNAPRALRNAHSCAAACVTVEERRFSAALSARNELGLQPRSIYDGLH
jgi:hypothetical protein